MNKVVVFETLEDGSVLEHTMYWIDAREAVANDPTRWSLSVPDPIDAPALEPDGTPVVKPRKTRAN